MGLSMGGSWGHLGLRGEKVALKQSKVALNDTKKLVSSTATGLWAYGLMGLWAYGLWIALGHSTSCLKGTVADNNKYDSNHYENYNNYNNYSNDNYYCYNIKLSNMPFGHGPNMPFRTILSDNAPKFYQGRFREVPTSRRLEF